MPQPCPARTQVCDNTPGSFKCLCPPGTYFINSTCRGRLLYSMYMSIVKSSIMYSRIDLKDGETPPPTEPPTSMATPQTATQDISLGLVRATFTNQTVAQVCSYNTRYHTLYIPNHQVFFQFSVENFKQVVAGVVSNHCNGSADCASVARRQRYILQFTVLGVFLHNLVVSDVPASK